MKRPKLAPTPRGVFLAGTAALALTVPAVRTAEAQDGFLFEEPRVTLGLRGGLNVASARSDVYDFFAEQLTLEHGDFSGLALQGEVGVQVAPRLDFVGGVGFTSTGPDSESRTHEGTDGLPITQSTRLSRVSVTAMLRYYPLPRGRGVGSNAWIPSRVTPFVGIGGGLLRYDLEQTGEFVDFETCDEDDVCDIFAATLVSEGRTGTVHVAGGADYWMTPRFGLSAEARYQWASAELSGDFVGFDDIDLGGLQAMLGLSVRL